MSLSNKITIVTGSSKGIGFAIAKEFAENNDATVIVCSRNLEHAQLATNKIKGKVYAAQLDVTDILSIKRLIEKIVNEHKGIDILVNNAGYPFENKIWYKKFHEISLEEQDKIFDVDFKGSVRLSRIIIPIMIKNKIIRNTEDKIERDKKVGGGVIINISSTPAITGYTNGFPYTIAKAANISLTKCIAREYSKDNIRAYCLTLGNIETESTCKSMNIDEKKNTIKESSMGRWGRPEEVARVAASIASDNFSYATGNTIILDGGTVIT